MKVHVIGEDPLQLIDLIKIIEKSQSYSILLAKWKLVCRNLGVTEVEVASLSAELHRGKTSNYDLLYEILNIWKTTEGSKATFEKLCDTLVKCGLTSIAEKLKKEINFEESTENVDEGALQPEEPTAAIIQPTDIGVCQSNQIANTNVQSNHLEGTEDINQNSILPAAINQNIFNTDTSKANNLESQPLLSGPRQSVKDYFVAIASAVMIVILISLITAWAIGRNAASPSPAYATSVLGPESLSLNTTESSLNQLFQNVSVDNNADFFESTQPTDTEKFQGGKTMFIPNQQGPTEITAGSYKELESMMQNKSISSSVYVKLGLISPSDWENEGVISYAEKITILGIRGPLFMEYFLQIMNQTKLLKVMHIDNLDNELCEINDGHLLQRKSIKKISLSALGALMLENFGSCIEVFDAVVGKLEMNSLKALRIKSGIINLKNIGYIQRLFQQTSDSLVSISLHNTVFSLDSFKPLFDSTRVQLPKLEYLHLDFLSNSKNSDVLFIGPTFCGFAPNLTHLRSDRGFAPWNQVRYLLRCKNLRKIKLAIEVLTSRSYFNTKFLKKLPKLREAELGLFHEGCASNNSTQHLRIEGVELLPTTLRKLTIQSNCKLRLESPSIATLNNRRPNYFQGKNKSVYGLKLDLVNRFPT